MTLLLKTEFLNEVEEAEPIETAKFVFKRIGPLMEHNYLCAICRKEGAVIETWRGWLQPCWTCQNKGFKLIKLNWLDKFLGRNE